MANYLTGDAGVPSDNATRLGVSAEQVTELNTFSTAHTTAYATCKDPNTHNTITVGEMRKADDEAYTFVLPLRQQIKNGSAEVLQADYEKLFIHQDKETRTPHQRPTTAPVINLVSSMHLVLRFEATTPTTEAINRVALPDSTKLAREVAVVAQGEQPTEDNYRPLDLVGRGRFDVMFTAAEVGMNAHLRCCYVSSRGEKGPNSPVLVSVII